MDRGVRFRVLGGVELLGDHGEVVPLRPTVRVLLAALLADRNRVVATEELVARVWGDPGPADPVASLHTAVARLRSVLPPERLRRAAPGYVLDVLDGEIDADVLLAAVAAGRHDEARTWWRGTPYGELGDRPWTVPDGDRLRAAHAVALGGAEPTLARAARSSWPFEGRQAELARFLDLVTTHGRGVALHGPAGVGKTRLAEEIVAGAVAAGQPGAFLRAGPAAVDLPLGAFAPLLAEEISRGSTGVPLLVEARRAVAELGRGRAVVLGVDDVHLLDPLSALVLNQLVTGGLAIAVLTHRTGEWVPEAVAQLWHEGLVDRSEIGELDRDTTVRLAEAMGGAPLSTDAADRLWQVTHGNPLFVHAVVHGAREAGAVTERTERDAIDAAIHASASVADFVEARLASLSPEAHDTLAVVALGEPVGLAVLERVTSPDVLVALEQGGFVRVTTDGRRTGVRLAHPLYGEVLRRGISGLLARAAYRELARAVQELGTRRMEDVLRVATWSLDGGARTDPSLLVRAALLAYRADDAALAERLASAVDDPALAVPAGLVLAEVQYDRDDAASNEALLAGLEGLATNDSERTAVAMVRARNAYWKQGDEATAISSIARALDVVEREDDRDQLVGLRALFDMYSCRSEEAIAASAPMLTGRPGRGYVWAALATAQALVSLGRGREATAVFEQAADVVRAVGGTRARLMQIAFDAGRPRCHVLLGDVHAAEAVARDALSIAVQDRDRQTWAVHLLTLGWVLTWRGHPQEGLEEAQRAAAHYRSVGDRSLERWAVIAVAAAATAATDAETARDALARVEALDPNPAVVFDGILWQARARLAVLEGDGERAPSMLREGIAWTRSHRCVLDEAVLRHALACCSPPGSPEARHDARLDEIARTTGGMPALLARHARARHGDDVPALSEVSEAFDRGGADGLAAHAAAEASAAAGRTGDVRTARRLAARAAEITARVGGATAIAAPSTVDAAPLSRREREVAELAAAGLPSRAIAERLFLSVRTVDNHLARAYDKLGVRTRADLADVLSA